MAVARRIAVCKMNEFVSLSRAKNSKKWVYFYAKEDLLGERGETDPFKTVKYCIQSVFEMARLCVHDI